MFDVPTAELKAFQELAKRFRDSADSDLGRLRNRLRNLKGKFAMLKNLTALRMRMRKSSWAGLPLKPG
ncbi:hypothetical protein [Brucella pseudogrignonensis]|uniref:hypothetical protein n=1 Tax=Brucella pseudogrignonensis TaxID=419475 RepID=UPI00148C105E|nr:hypothetical protein [Brucella pseudogrignonensis]